MIPDGIVSSVWPRVERRLASVDVRFDEWQRGFSSAALGCRADGKYAASVGGVVESIPRQVGKTYKDGNLAIGLAAEFPRTRIAWTSHHNRTTTNTFRKMQGLVTRKKMLPLLAPNGIRVANGEQEIRFGNGSIIMFGAREQGFGRGLDEIDFLFFDESQILSLSALEDMVPATNQAQHPHGGLVFFLGTPPRPKDEGEAFRALRKGALDGSSPTRMLVELSADPTAAWDDREQWRKMNPSYPHRTSDEAMLRMRELIPDEDAWRREAMGIWDDEDETAKWLVWSRGQWAACQDLDAPETGWLTGPVCLGIEVTPDRSMASIGVAGECEGGTGIDLAARDADTGWLIPHTVRLCLERDVARVVIDEKSAAGNLIEPLRAALADAGCKTVVVVANASELATATGDIHDAVIARSLRHRARPEIDDAVAHAKKRDYGPGGRWLLDRRNGVDITPITAPILARHGHSLGPVQSPDSVYESRGPVTL